MGPVKIYLIFLLIFDEDADSGSKNVVCIVLNLVKYYSSGFSFLKEKARFTNGAPFYFCSQFVQQLRRRHEKSLCLKITPVSQ